MEHYRKPVLVTVTNELGVGGVQMLLARVLPLLTQFYEVHCVCYRAKGILFDSLPEQGVQTHFIPSHGRFNVRTLWKYARFFRSVQADIVHAHSHTGNVFAILAATLARVPVKIGHIHTGLHFFGSSAFRRRRQAFEESMVLRLCNAKMLVISKDMLDFGKRTLSLPDSAFELVHNGVVLPTFYENVAERTQTLRTTYNLTEHERIFGFVGRLEPIKGLDFLLDQVEAWQVAGEKFTLFILGSGNAECTKKWQERAARIGDGKRVVWLGVQKDVYSWYPCFDLFLFTSLPKVEGMGMVMVEAAFHGLPILVRRIGTAEEVHEYYDRMTFFDDHDSPHEALQAALSNGPDTSRRIEHFSIEAMAERLRNLYDGLLAGC